MYSFGLLDTKTHKNFSAWTFIAASAELILARTPCDRTGDPTRELGCALVHVVERFQYQFA